MNYDNTQVIIDLDAIERNIDAVAQKTGLPIMAIIKADAYGHGAIQVARLLEEKCAFFGVSSMLEAMELRRAELTTPILILGYTPVSAFPTAIKNGIRPSIFHYDDALALSIAKATHIRISQAYLFTDLTVLLLSLSYIPFRRIAYSLITVTISSWLIDLFQMKK